MNVSVNLVDVFWERRFSLVGCAFLDDTLRMRRSYFHRTIPRLLPGAAALCLNCAVAYAGDRVPSTWVNGAYSFSDELGGFKITGTGGNGTRENPFVISQEVFSASPVTLVIRGQRPVRTFDPSGDYPNGFTHFRFEVRNVSGLGWLECAFELQEVLNKASVFGDGLSFDQRRTDTDTISSDSFSRWSRDFEPYDKLLFTGGKVDPLTVATFSFLVTDFTPKRTFYIVFDPSIPFS